MEELAAKVGVDKGQISIWEKGKRIPHFRNIELLETALGIKFQDYESQNNFKKSNVNFGDANQITQNNDQKMSEPVTLYATALDIIKEQLVIKDEQIKSLLEILKSK